MIPFVIDNIAPPETLHGLLSLSSWWLRVNQAARLR